MAEYRYLEIVEILEEGDELEKQPLMVRIEVKDEDEARSLYPQYEVLFKGRKYKVQYHVHYHSKEGKNLPCEIKVLKESDGQ